ncbi:xylan glycosyltransferase MUCI21 [Aristolochia californica]|uniref:xylan glycosyltransferase MUCI21 n=1 Tax=Aristolochia californica TaxID=171875 RepID=UPI0035E328DC
MVHHYRLNQLRKGDVEETQDSEAQALLTDCGKKTRPRLLPLLLLFSLISCSLVFLPCFSNLPFFYFGSESPLLTDKQNPLPCSDADASDCIYCDRTGYRSDICYMRGDVRTHSPSASVLLYSWNVTASMSLEKIKPYTRKWEMSVMDTIDELRLVRKSSTGDAQDSCQTNHTVPAIFFSTGGYTGNVYHEFNDGLIPLYITSKKFNRQVVFVILEYHNWWMTKYGDILSRLSDYPPIDFSGDKSTHCFQEAIVGLQIHDELSIDPALIPDSQTNIQDFRRLLDEAYRPRIRSLIQEEEQQQVAQEQRQVQPLEVKQIERTRKPKLVILSRNGSRAITNEGELVKLAEEVGFEVQVLQPDRTTELAKIYRALNGSQVMIGVHGAAMTHFLFMRPRTVFIQVVPLGTEWAAEAYYGEPAVKMGLKYMSYKIGPKESSLYTRYRKDDPVLTEPMRVNKKGWEVTKSLYLDGQTVNLDLSRFKKRLLRVYTYCNYQTNTAM